MLASSRKSMVQAAALFDATHGRARRQAVRHRVAQSQCHQDAVRAATLGARRVEAAAYRWALDEASHRVDRTFPQALTR